MNDKDARALESHVDVFRAKVARDGGNFRSKVARDGPKGQGCKGNLGKVAHPYSAG